MLRIMPSQYCLAISIVGAGGAQYIRKRYLIDLKADTVLDLHFHGIIYLNLLIISVISFIFKSKRVL